MPGPAWACLGLSGPAWTRLCLPGPVWACLGLSGPAWACLGLPGPGISFKRALTILKKRVCKKYFLMGINNLLRKRSAKHNFQWALTRGEVGVGVGGGCVCSFFSIVSFFFSIFSIIDHHDFLCISLVLVRIIEKTMAYFQVFGIKKYDFPLVL